MDPLTGEIFTEEVYNPEKPVKEVRMLWKHCMSNSIHIYVFLSCLSSMLWKIIRKQFNWQKHHVDHLNIQGHDHYYYHYKFKIRLCWFAHLSQDLSKKWVFACRKLKFVRNMNGFIKTSILYKQFKPLETMWSIALSLHCIWNKSNSLTISQHALNLEIFYIFNMIVN